ncbi:hypothetical protein COBT_003669, partial [Conglomerata obtusa]
KIDKDRDITWNSRAVNGINIEANVNNRIYNIKGANNGGIEFKNLRKCRYEFKDSKNALLLFHNTYHKLHSRVFYTDNSSKGKKIELKSYPKMNQLCTLRSETYTFAGHNVVMIGELYIVLKVDLQKVM